MTGLARLLEPGRIGKMPLRNRFVMAATATSGGDGEGNPGDRMIDFYAARAGGGVGLIITGAFSISPETSIPGSGLNAYDDKFTPRLKDLVGAIHTHGAKVAAMLVHPGHLLASFGRPEAVLGPSAVPVFCREELGPVPREATSEDIKKVIGDFAGSAARAKEAGFDGVEINAGSAFLLSAFGSPYVNKRTDEYGGSPENRARLTCEVVAAVRERVGPDFPVIVLMTGRDFVGDGGLTIEEAAFRAPLYVRAGADALHARYGFCKSVTGYPPMEVPGFMLGAAAAIKKAVEVPVLVCGSIDPLLGERTLAEGKADFIAIARGLLADPRMPAKIREGRLSEVCPCIGFACFECSLLRSPGEFIRCLVNPALGREAEFAGKRRGPPRRVMVVGGGLAGMEAAVTLAARGHEVSLYEKAGRLGGQWDVAAREPGKEKFAEFTAYLASSLERLGAGVVLGEEVTPELVRQVSPDVVILATGAEPLIPDIPGIRGKNVVLARDVIAGRCAVGSTVAVVGARLMGMEVAVFLAEQGSVSLIDRYEIARGVLEGKALILMDRLKKAGVRMYPASPVVEIKGDGVLVSREGKTEFISADTVVLAAGMKPENSLAAALEGVAGEIYSIGDCADPRKAMDAVYDGLRIASLI
ncbi:FAD-dependent oxidoreductase [Chloroflexota bacterium]